MTTSDNQMVPRLTFVDFMYAMVVGSVFRLLAPLPGQPLDLNFQFFGILFLLLVVLEDFYLYHTQILTQSQPRQSSLSDLRVLVLKIGILRGTLALLPFRPNQRFSWQHSALSMRSSGWPVSPILPPQVSFAAGAFTATLASLSHLLQDAFASYSSMLTEK